ncbi:hypothetical protein ACFYNY_32980 [Streptomyces sp. NPDC006530]|uniref:hypothetical protein n=1 Tax=Streptomyces sp. NPDC006530 TaxID=3364750 RepID=UPI003685B7A7
MPHPFGYQKRTDGSVLITRGCRPMSVVKEKEKVSAFLSDLARENPQQVMARWVSVLPRIG